MLRAIDPTTGHIVREIPLDSGSSVETKLARAQECFVSWRRASFLTRARVLHAVADELMRSQQHLKEMMTQEMGKPAREARAEVEKAAWCARHYADMSEEYLKEEVICSDATRSSVVYQALGPILGILPWNLPIWLTFRFCAPALMAGNTCLIKHDPHTPGCAQAIVEVFERAGAPHGLVQALFLESAEVESVIRDRRIHGVSFTGSTRGGAFVASIAASEIKRTVLELGGSDPCVVLSDADLKLAAETIVLSRTINGGQSCIAAKRIIVEQAIYDELIELLLERLARLKVADPRDETTDIGPIARADLRDILHEQVTQTMSQGARCLLGGQLPKGEGYFYPVTLLVDVEPSMPAFREETFGPVAVVIKARDVDHAIDLANDTEYGLAASLWTEAERGAHLAERIDAGQVVVNGLVKTDPRLPSGGIKRSGYGRELGAHGIREFTNIKQLWIGPKVG